MYTYLVDMDYLRKLLQIVDKMYITEVDLNIEDGDTFFPEFDINDFEVLVLK